MYNRDRKIIENGFSAKELYFMFGKTEKQKPENFAEKQNKKNFIMSETPEMDP